MSSIIGGEKETAEGGAAARAFLLEVDRIDKARLDTNATPELRTAAVMATAVQFLVGELLNQTEGFDAARAVFAGLGIGAACQAGQWGDPRVLHGVAAAISEGYSEGAARTLATFRPTAPPQ